MTADEIKIHTRRYAGKSDALGALSLLATFAVISPRYGSGGCMTGQSFDPVPMVVVLAFASVRLIRFAT